ncbi:hypothetical protein AAMO2058_000889700 [Amorphochlora amoebiformis]
MDIGFKQTVNSDMQTSEKFERANWKTFGGNTISSKEANSLVKNGENVLFVDIRTKEERDVSFIPGSIDEEKFWTMDLKALKNTHIVSYCTIGFRSGLFAQKLKNKGLEHVYNSEGIVLWTHDSEVKLIHKNKNGKEEPAKKVHVYGASWDLASNKYETVKFSGLGGVGGTLYGIYSRMWR